MPLLGHSSLSFSSKSQTTPFNPVQVSGLIAWWNASNVNLDGTNTFVTSIQPFAGSSSSDNTYVVSNSDGTFATVPIWFVSGVSGWTGQTLIGTTVGTDESRFLAGANPISGSGIAEPATWYTCWMAGSNTNNIYLRLNLSGSQAQAHSYLASAGTNVLLAQDSVGGSQCSYSLNTPYVGCNIYSATSGHAAAFLNNSASALGTGTCGGDDYTQLFFGTFADGEIAQYWWSDMLCYSGEHTSTQRGEIMQWLSTNRNIPGYSP